MIIVSFIALHFIMSIKQQMHFMHAMMSKLEKRERKKCISVARRHIKEIFRFSERETFSYLVHALWSIQHFLSYTKHWHESFDDWCKYSCAWSIPQVMKLMNCQAMCVINWLVQNVIGVNVGVVSVHWLALNKSDIVC